MSVAVQVTGKRNGKRSEKKAKTAPSLQGSRKHGSLTEGGRAVDTAVTIPLPYTNFQKSGLGICSEKDASFRVPLPEDKYRAVKGGSDSTAKRIVSLKKKKKKEK